MINTEFMPKGVRGFKKGHIVPEEIKIKMSLSRIGKKLSKETKEKMRQAHIGKKYKKMSLIGRKNLSLSHLGKNQSAETIQKRVKGRKGYKHSEETKMKISKANYNPEAKCRDKNSYEKNRLLNNLENLAGRKKPQVCEICGEINKKICFDHCHKTGRFRGWVCHRCNFVLGLVKDDSDVLKKLIKYLKC